MDKVKILDEINRLIKLYNKDSFEQIAITRKINDVRDFYLAYYDYDKVGLFKAIKFSSSIYKQGPFSSPIYDAGIVYVGINTDKIAIKDTHKKSVDFVCFRPIGCKVEVDNKSYVSNCKIHYVIGFDELRMELYKQNLIPEYTLGKASDYEMFEVLDLAYDYFDVKNNELAKIFKK